MPLPSTGATETDQEQRDLGEVLRQVLARARRAAGRAVHGQHHGAVCTEGLEHLAPGPIVERGQPGLDLRVIDQDEAPPLADVRGTDGGVQDPSLGVMGDRIGLQVPHGAGRIQRLVDVQEALLMRPLPDGLISYLAEPFLQCKAAPIP